MEREDSWLNRSLSIFRRKVETDCELVELNNVDSIHFDMVLLDLIRFVSLFRMSKRQFHEN